MPRVVRGSPRLEPDRHDRHDREDHPEVRRRPGAVALQQADDDRDGGADDRGDRRDDAHRADGERRVEQQDPHRAEQRRADPGQRRPCRVPADEQGQRHDEDEARGSGEDEGLQRRRAPRGQAPDEVRHAPHQRRDEGEERGHGRQSSTPGPGVRSRHGRDTRARRRAGRGGRAVRDRGGVPARARASGDVLRRARGARRDRRHVGPVPLPGHPVGLRHAHPRLPVPAVARRRDPRRRSLDPALRAGHRRRARRDAEGAVAPPRRRGRLVERRRALDRRGAAQRHRREVAADLPVPVLLHGLLPLRPWPRAGHRRSCGLPRRGRPPAALARGPRRTRQAGRGDRQRRDGDHAGARTGRHRPARRDAAALTDLRRVAPLARRRGGPPEPCAARGGGLPRRAAQEHRDGGPQLPPLPTVAEGDEHGARQRRTPPAARGLRRRHALHAALRPLDPAPLRRPRRRPVRGDHRGRRLGRHRHGRALHADRPAARVGHRSSTPTSS